LLRSTWIAPEDNNYKKSLENHMRRFGFLLAVLVLVIFLSALFSKPSVVNRGTAQRMEHYPTVGIGDIFRGH
uniref:hypothetical protein n=1 Tax=Stenotrophomonas maltophilia TaxID=40324 RepID=UPI0019535FC8